MFNYMKADNKQQFRNEEWELLELRPTLIYDGQYSEQPYPRTLP